MAGLNRAELIGHLGADPEIRYTPSGKAIANFRIATSENYTKDGEKKTHTEWHKVVAFDRLAEICGEYLAKGKRVYIDGKIRTRSWDDKDGNKKYTTEILANSMIMLGGTTRGGESAEAPQEGARTEGVEEDVPF